MDPNSMDIPLAERGVTARSHDSSGDKVIAEGPCAPAMASTTLESLQSPRAQKVKDSLLIATVVMAQVIAQGQFGASLVSIQEIGKWLGTSDAAQFSWMLATYGLTMGLFVIVTGRAGDIYGPRKMVVIGYSLYIIFNIGVGLCKTPLQYDILRAFSGIAGAFVLPNSAAILGRTWRPGKKRTFAFAMFGATGPAGFVGGAVLGAAISDRFGPRWIYFFFSIASFCTCLSAIFFLPRDEVDGQGSLDIIGCIIGFSSMVLFNFSWNQAAIVGWNVPYVYAILLVSSILMGVFFWYESRLGDKAIMPIRMLTKEVVLVCLAMWWGWMSLGTFLYYTTSFIRTFRMVDNALDLTLQMLPLAPCGIAAALSVMWMFSRVSGHWMLAMAMFCFTVGNLLSALSAVKQTYWALTFPAMCIVVFGPDISFAAAALIVSNSVDRELQGVGASLVSLTTNYSMSIGLGIAGTVEYYVREHSNDTLQGYRAALWFATALAAAGFLIVVAFVRTKPPRDLDLDSMAV